MTSRIYCAVFGCMNSSITHPEIAFFKLPASPERRLLWLQLISREDLENKPNFSSYRVCEKHFNSEDVLQSAKRKLLKKNAIPFLLLPNLASSNPGVSRKEDKQTQTVPLGGNENCTQTEYATKEHSTQTSKSLYRNTPRERELKDQLLQCRKILKLHKNKNETLKAAKNTFHRLCDRFLTDKLALLIKAQIKLKQHGKGNRYDNDYITYCLNLYRISPQAYQFLQSALCLPCPSTLYNHSSPTTTEINEKALSVLS